MVLGMENLLEYREKHPDAFNSKGLINDNIYKYASDVESVKI